MVKMGTDFIGEQALKDQIDRGLERKLVGFEMTEPGIARDGYDVICEDRTVAEVTSGGFSPSLNKSIGLAYLPSGMAEVGHQLQIVIRKSPRAARVVETPFYESPKN